MNKWILETLMAMGERPISTGDYFIALAISFIQHHCPFSLRITHYEDQPSYWYVYCESQDFTLAGRSETLEVALALLIRDLCRELRERKGDNADQGNEQGNDDTIDETRAGQAQANARVARLPCDQSAADGRVPRGSRCRLQGAGNVR